MARCEVCGNDYDKCILAVACGLPLNETRNLPEATSLRSFSIGLHRLPLVRGFFSMLMRSFGMSAAAGCD
jgi:hypothetical protein